MSALWPTVHARLLAILPTLTGLSADVVFDGPPAKEPGVKQWIAVGASSADGDAGVYEQPDSAVTSLREESGSVVCEFVSWSGDDDLAAHRAAVFGWADALEAQIRSDQRLGVLPAGSTTILSARPVPVRNTGGTAFRLLVTVTYFTRS